MQFIDAIDDITEIAKSAIWIALICLTISTVKAAPPHPELLKDITTGKTSVPFFASHLDEMRAKGISSSQPFRQFSHNKFHDINHDSSVDIQGVSRTPDYVGQFKVLAILVNFTDHTNSTVATFFDSLVFGHTGITVADYYDEVSYGQVDLVTVNLPSSLGWQTAPQPYAYYVNGENGTGGYPTNSQKLVEDLVDQIDPLVDFSQYDNNSDGFVDVLMVIHSGKGAEFTGSDDDMWSHKWGISSRYRDGVFISDYTIQPEYLNISGDMTIGVYAHELGHVFGLPDLYDTDYSSNGVGRWCIMSYGSWLGPNGLGGVPAHFCAWCKSQIGMLTPVNVASNTSNQNIPHVEGNSVAYRLWNAGNIGNEYFLVENRQKVGYDTYLPGSGLLIWHVDESRSGNDQEWYPGLSATSHYEVALEQADGFFEIEKDIDNGDNGDPFPGVYNQTSFNAMTVPNSDSYSETTSYVNIDNISSSGSTMYADLLVGFSAGSNDDNAEEPTLPVSAQLEQNYPNPFNPTTTICFSGDNTRPATVEVYNSMGQKVAIIFDGYAQSGKTSVTWDGTNNNGSPVSSGVYFYKLRNGDYEQTRKMVLIR
ncbi:MAG: M6 family metalloprotease domain-containing protein [candidate division Zixibacteria bacterium]|nr:M6 family metalloprotease domain-containing protein [candidate division Zixibacteria bacterium]